MTPVACPPAAARAPAAGRGAGRGEAAPARGGRGGRGGGAADRIFGSRPARPEGGASFDAEGAPESGSGRGGRGRGGFGGRGTRGRGATRKRDFDRHDGTGRGWVGVRRAGRGGSSHAAAWPARLLTRACSKARTLKAPAGGSSGVQGAHRPQSFWQGLCWLAAEAWPPMLHTLLA